MSLIWSRGRPLLVTRPANMFPSRKREKTEAQTADQKQNSVSEALCPGHSWGELAAPQGQIQSLLHPFPPFPPPPYPLPPSALNPWKASFPDTHSFHKQLVGVRHRLACCGQYEEILFYVSQRASNPFWNRKQYKYT